MLLERNFVQGDVVSVKLVTNEEIVAKFLEQDTNTITITKPLVLSISVDGAGKPGLQMYPFFILGADGDEKLPLKKEHIIAVIKSRDDVKSGYIHNTTGLTIPGANSNNGLIT